MKIVRIYGMAQTVIPVKIVNGKEYRVFVNDSERGHTPHFHFQIGSNPGKDKFKPDFESCISLTDAEYSKEHKVQKVTADDAQWLDTMFRRRHHKYDCTNWEFACYLWNNSLSNREYEFDAQPDYTQLYTI